ncbi:hypothetical protein J6590_037007 [Homalodisca vitripennis]|nr:hypothetical protein J6590_037007 [Homalodisca vitripennis]
MSLKASVLGLKSESEANLIQLLSNSPCVWLNNSKDFRARTSPCSPGSEMEREEGCKYMPDALRTVPEDLKNSSLTR